MTKGAIHKLNEKQVKYCKTMSAVIAIDRKNGAKEQYEKDTGELRGYLECLMQMGIITEVEMRALYLWFFAENRSERSGRDGTEVQKIEL